MINLFKDILFSKTFSTWVASFRQFTKKVWCTFFAYFSIKTCLILYPLVEFQSQIGIISQDISFTIPTLSCDDITNLIYFWSPFSSIADRGKVGKVGLRKCEYLENEKSFLDQIKSIIQNFLMAFFLKNNRK